ncbi:MAG: aminoacyl-histidine dipeptidase [Spirochaetales bacterium]|nr:aminoacyl-histidine dipeptidase [Spirochaetales bacterium]
MPTTLLSNFEPKDVWTEFLALTKTPRCSKQEEKVLGYLEEKALRKGYNYQKDRVGNLFVDLPPTKGSETIPGIILQSHVDMVCEQNRGRNHDFSKDPLDLIVEEDWLRARDTTLGADNGIGVAYMAALLEGSYNHGPLQLLFTIDEETGLTGAIQIQHELLKYKKMINLDTEEEGYFCIGCAGGKETIGTLRLQKRVPNPSEVTLDLEITGLRGGHSGAEIHLELGNSLVILGRILGDFIRVAPLHLFHVYGGDKHNAIPREAFATFSCSKIDLAKFQERLVYWESILKNELGSLDQGIVLKLLSTSKEPDNGVLTAEDQSKIINALQTIPHGIYGWSRAIENLVSTSTNFAAMHMDKESARFLTSQRSDQTTQRDWIALRTGAAMAMSGMKVKESREYPGWNPNPNSPLLKECLRLYPEISGKEGIIQSIHAGLECGVIGDKIPGIDMISFGPDIRAPHTPGEKVSISSVRRTWEFLLRLLEAGK